MENYFVERKHDSDALIIAFSGNANELMGDSFEFFAITNTLNCSRILLKDPSKRIYLEGIRGEFNSLEKLVRKLKLDIEEMNPKTVTLIGTSGGGFAAILYGHLLKADFVHAFGPTTRIHPLKMLKNHPLEKIKKNYKIIILGYMIYLIYYLRPKVSKFFDLKKVLLRYNGVTQYFIYVCEGHAKDVEDANHLKNCKNLQILKQPCNVHNVVRCMIKNQTLFKIFNTGTTDAVTS